jgi:hypothetical protein
MSKFPPEEGVCFSYVTIACITSAVVCMVFASFAWGKMGKRWPKYKLTQYFEKPRIPRHEWMMENASNNILIELKPARFRTCREDINSDSVVMVLCAYSWVKKKAPAAYTPRTPALVTRLNRFNLFDLPNDTGVTGSTSMLRACQSTSSSLFSKILQ